MKKLTAAQLKKEAKALAKNRLLPMLLEQRRGQILETWRNAGDTMQREQQWLAMREVDSLAGAVEDGLRKYGGDADT